MTQLKMLTADDKLAEIRRLYFQTSAKTIREDFAKALELLKSMANDDERERAAVFMDGMAEMLQDWTKRERRKSNAAKPPHRAKKPQKQ
jgi:hypothetical protein